MSGALESVAFFGGLALLYYAGDLIKAARGLIGDWIEVRRIHAENERAALRIADRGRDDEP